MKEWLVEHFWILNAGFVLGLILLLLRGFQKSENQSRFRVREADRNLKFPRGKDAQTLGDAKMKRAAPPLTLDGISIHGAPHEILGISAHAGEAEIQKAFRERMKRYHPDKIARPGTPQWQEAQRIAEALNRARAEMLAKRG